MPTDEPNERVNEMIGKRHEDIEVAVTCQVWGKAHRHEIPVEWKQLHDYYDDDKQTVVFRRLVIKLRCACGSELER